MEEQLMIGTHKTICIVSYLFSALSSTRKLYFTLNKTSCGIVVLLNSCDHLLQKLQPFQPPSPCHYWTNMILLIITIIHLNAYLVFKFKLIFKYLSLKFLESLAGLFYFCKGLGQDPGQSSLPFWSWTRSAYNSNSMSNVPAQRTISYICYM